MHDLKQRLLVQHHPAVRAGTATGPEVLRGLLAAMDASGNGTVSREEVSELKLTARCRFR